MRRSKNDPSEAPLAILRCGLPPMFASALKRAWHSATLLTYWVRHEPVCSRAARNHLCQSEAQKQKEAAEKQQVERRRQIETPQQAKRKRQLALQKKRQAECERETILLNQDVRSAGSRLCCTRTAIIRTGIRTAGENRLCWVTSLHQGA